MLFVCLFVWIRRIGTRNPVHSAFPVWAYSTKRTPDGLTAYNMHGPSLLARAVIRTRGDNVANIGPIHTACGLHRQALNETQARTYPPIVQAIATTDCNGYFRQEVTPKGGPLAELEQP